MLGLRSSSGRGLGGEDRKSLKRRLGSAKSPMNKTSDPLFVEYWRYQDRLSRLYEAYCEKCIGKPFCWTLDEGAYREDAILARCPVEEVRRTITRLKELVDKRGDVMYFAATAEELEIIAREHRR